MWEKLGFTLDRKAKDITATLRVAGKIVLRTRRSHGAGKLDGQIPIFIRQQMRLNERQFVEAIQCPLSREGYFEILEGKGAL
jgi:hypothetical protein